jgi:hypothetical protein
MSDLESSFSLTILILCGSALTAGVKREQMKIWRNFVVFGFFEEFYFIIRAFFDLHTSCIEVISNVENWRKARFFRPNNLGQA